MNFADRLFEAVENKKCNLCVGIDPRLDSLPEEITSRAKRLYGNTIEAAIYALREFSFGVIDAIYEIIPVAKPQAAFFEAFGAAGFALYEAVVHDAKEHGLVVIADAKRNDIGSTVEGYAGEMLGKTGLFDGKKVPIVDADALTVNSYLGIDGVKPFIEACKEYDKGIFCLVKTSNKSSGEIQDLLVEDAAIYEKMGKLVSAWGKDLIGAHGYSSIGAVVGATYPEQAGELRELMSHTPFLVPGYGAQGGGAKGVVPAFDAQGRGAIVNSSRGVIFAYEKEPYKNMNWKDAVRQAAIDSRDDINSAVKPEGW